jgi:hypothetical protein
LIARRSTKHQQPHNPSPTGKRILINFHPLYIQQAGIARKLGASSTILPWASNKHCSGMAASYRLCTDRQDNLIIDFRSRA